MQTPAIRATWGTRRSLTRCPSAPGPHRVAIEFTRKDTHGTAEFFLDGRRISKVRNVDLPLDVQGHRYTGIYPSMGPGERVAQKVSGFAIGHGLFSLLDDFRVEIDPNDEDSDED